MAVAGARDRRDAAARARAANAAGTVAASVTVVMVGDTQSVHVQRWSAAFAERGMPVVSVHLSAKGRSPLSTLLNLIRARVRIGRLARRPGTVIAEHYVRGGLLATGMRGVHPIVVSVWGNDATSERGGWRGRLAGRQLRGLVRTADGVTATSHFLAEVVRRRFGVEPTIVPFGIDCRRFHPPELPPAAERRTGTALPADSELPPDRAPATGAAPAPLRIGFVKWLEPKYGPDVLIESFGLLRDEVPFVATLAGGGSLHDSLVARAAALGIADRVTFLGRVPHADVPDLLRGFDLFVMPSRFEEWGVAAAEAAASGLPVVATAAGGIPEIVVHGETGLLVAPDDPVALAAAICRLARDPGLRRSMGRAGRARVEALFPWDRCVEQMIEVLRSALERDERREERAGV